MQRRGDTPMPDPAALADAITHAACRVAENLIDNVCPWYAGSLPMTAADPDALRALIAEARTTAPAPRLHTLRERRNAAGAGPRTWRPRDRVDVVARLDPRYRLRNVSRARTRRHLLGCDRLSWLPVRLRLRSVRRRKVTCRRTLRVERFRR